MDRLSSVRLTILICILLALFSLVGTLIPQNLPPDQYRQSYGPGMGGLVEALGLSDVYHSPGFVFMLCLLSLNLVACTTKRFPKVWRSVKREGSLHGDPDFHNWKNQETFSLAAPGPDQQRALAEIVTRRLGRGTKRIATDSGKEVFRSEKNRFSRFGPYLSHVSILLILAGGLVGAWFGFDGMLILSEGQQAASVQLRGEQKTVPLGFQIRCNRFLTEYYGDSRKGSAQANPVLQATVKEYRSEVSVLDEQGNLLRDAAIRVNHPLTYEGITFYQANYGQAASVSLQVIDQQSGQQSELEVDVDTPFPLPGGRGDRGIVMDFQENMRIPQEMMRMTRFPKADLGPAARVGVMVQDKGFQEPAWVMKDFPDMGGGREGPYRFFLKGFRTVPYTGLHVARDPGTGLVWTGCILLVVGFLVSFLLDHEILYVTLEPGRGGGVTVRMAGRAVRHPAVYAGRFDKRRKEMRQALSPWLRRPASPDGTRGGGKS